MLFLWNVHGPKALAVAAPCGVMAAAPTGHGAVHRLRLGLVAVTPILRCMASTVALHVVAGSGLGLGWVTVAAILRGVAAALAFVGTYG